MVSWIRDLQNRAVEGFAPCGRCPAYEAGRANHATPGFGNPDGDLLVLTAAPLDPFDRETYESWQAYNDTHTDPSLSTGRGGPDLEALLDPIEGCGIDDLWIGHTVKCPPGDDESRALEFESCQHYLKTEIQAVDPQLLLGLGGTACLRALDILGINRSHVPVSKECGRLYQTDPPLLVSTHWQYGWLDRDPHDEWGTDWQHHQPAFDADYDSYREIIQDAIVTHFHEK